MKNSNYQPKGYGNYIIGKEFNADCRNILALICSLISRYSSFNYAYYGSFVLSAKVDLGLFRSVDQKRPQGRSPKIDLDRLRTLNYMLSLEKYYVKLIFSKMTVSRKSREKRISLSLISFFGKNSVNVTFCNESYFELVSRNFFFFQVRVIFFHTVYVSISLLVE